MASYKHFTVDWAWRSHEPAKCPPNPDYPDGKVITAPPGETYCNLPLLHPAPGVGTWIVTCNRCGLKLAITTAGRPDDPKAVQAICKRTVH